MPDFLEKAWVWLQQDDHLEKLILAVVTSLVVALLTWLRKGISQALAGIFGQLWNRLPYREEIARYRAQLDRDALKIHHAWMKEGQTLGDILVPVSVESGRLGKGVESLSAILAEALKPGKVRHLVVTGGPGSGKSVALRLAARSAWTLPSLEDGKPRVPVLLTFSDYRAAKFDLTEALVSSLRARGFRRVKGRDQGTIAREFVQDALAEGRLLILIDALDELGGADRVTAVQSLRTELKALALTPVILSCRTAAWHDQLKDLDCIELKMEPFTPAAIRQFVRSWGFNPPKSAAELIAVIESQPHVGNLARNPLMLTIVAFLYSQPRYRLPENRAQFYEVCSRALLEEWDQHENPARANQYDRPHKEILLGQLAYQHLRGPKPDEDIEEPDALKLIAEGLHQLGIVRAGNAKVLDEIVLNSGLLVRLPPSGLRFPHQTYLEFFAALHLLRQESPQVLLDHYWKEAARWREVVLLYCGLNTDIAQSSWTVRELLQKDSVESALAALIDARAVDHKVVEEVLTAAEQRLASNPTRALITGLGYLSANPLSAYAERAGTLLRSLLDQVAEKKLPADLLEDLLLAVLRRPTEESTRFIIDHAEELDLRRLLPAMADRALVMATKVLGQPNLSHEKKVEWIDGLRRAGAVRLLYSLAALNREDSILGQAAAIALARCSAGEEFWECLDDPDLVPLDGGPESERLLRGWRWPFARPAQERGRKAFFSLASSLANAVRSGSCSSGEAEDEGVHRLLSYLACGIYFENGYHGFPWTGRWGEAMLSATPGTIRSIWKSCPSKRWMKWMQACVSAWKWGFSVSFLLGIFCFIWTAIGALGVRVGISQLFAIGYVSASIVVIVGIFLFGLIFERESLNFKAVMSVIMTAIGVLPFSILLIGAEVLSRIGIRRAISVPRICLGVVAVYWLVAIFAPANLVLKVLLAILSMQFLFVGDLLNIASPPIFASSKTVKICEELIGSAQSLEG
jgi:hypothetical protein